jgi:predicted DNA-binding WGR domain protein
MIVHKDAIEYRAVSPEGITLTRFWGRTEAEAAAEFQRIYDPHRISRAADAFWKHKQQEGWKLVPATPNGEGV